MKCCTLSVWLTSQTFPWSFVVPPNADSERLMEHEYHALYWHFGPYGPQDVHMHQCITHEHCRHELQGEGRDCGGDRLSLHTPVVYRTSGRRSAWVTGEPLAPNVQLGDRA